MNKELAKIDYYLEEVQKHWEANPDFASGPHFYAAWENIQRPCPFSVDSEELSFADQIFHLTEETPGKTACFSWDQAEESAALVIEGKEWREKILITIEDGTPSFFKSDPVYLEQMGLSYGERLEIIYDVIDYMKKNSPSVDLLTIKKKDFLSALEGVAANYDPKAVAVMKKLSKHSIERFIRKASEDMTHDEISAQLTLPLNGTYAAGPTLSDDDNTYFDDAPDTNAVEMVIPSRTDWAVIRDLQVQEKALRLELEEEQNFVLSFADAETVENQGDREILFKFTVTKESPLAEGDRLKVFNRGTKEPVGTFIVDIFDGTVIYGRMRFFDAGEMQTPLNRLYALPRRSPRKFLAESIENLIKIIEEGEAPDLMMKITGMIETPFTESMDENVPDEMDNSQKRAYSCAVNEKNALTLIQGPPGTGKSKVLVDVVHRLCSSGKRILITAPSNTAVDNISRKLIKMNLPLLRFGKNEKSIASDVAASNWIGNEQAVMRFADMRKESGGSIYAGTHIGLLWDDIVRGDISKNGLFDAIIFDEAGMASINEFLLLSMLADKVVLFGDHKQLPPFPLSETVRNKLNSESGPFLASAEILLGGSALEWLAEARGFPVIMLTSSYRCQNPRLLRFSSILFYDALVSPSKDAEYYKLSYSERENIYPRSTLKMVSTSLLPDKVKNESLIFEGTKPGIENRSEAIICVYEIYRLIQKYPLTEVTLIAPYKRQVKLIRSMLSHHKAEKFSKKKFNTKTWDYFLYNCISTVDSFQGGESDAVITCYVRSNKHRAIGFVDDANRINVAHTRCRKEMVVIGDIECLKASAGNDIFKRLERTVRRDGIISKPDIKLFNQMESLLNSESAEFADFTETTPETSSLPKISDTVPAAVKEEENKDKEENSPVPLPQELTEKPATEEPPTVTPEEPPEPAIENEPLELLQPDLFG